MRIRKEVLLFLTGALLSLAVYVFVPKEGNKTLHTDHKNGYKRDQRVHEKNQTELDRKEKIRLRFADRVNRLNTVCDATHQVNKSVAYESAKPIAYGRLLHCGIPKVGTTFTGHVLKQLFKVTKPNNSYTGPTKKYVIVREPYSRMVSGYIDKIVGNQQWWKNYGTYIIRTNRKNASAEDKRCGNNVSFPEFIAYLIKAQATGRRKNFHWQPMNELCNFCKQRFDYVLNLETLKEDFRYIYNSVNISISTNFSDERMTMSGKSMTIVRQRPETSKCENTCVTLGKIWWSFQARGLIADDMALPITGSRCDTITGEEFADLTWKAHLESSGRIDKRKKKKNIREQLFLQVPLQDRLKLRDLYREDFDLFGYDPQPPDLFPELHQAKKEK